MVAFMMRHNYAHEYREELAAWDEVAAQRYTSWLHSKWTRTAINCLTLNHDCALCPISQHYDLSLTHQNQARRCKMAHSVQTLIERGIPMPARKEKQP